MKFSLQRKWASGRKSSLGMSVVEVIIAFAVIALVALASASFFNQQRLLLSNFTPNSECKSVLESQMNYIRQQGTAAIGLPWTESAPTGGVTTHYAVGEPSRYQDPWLPASVRYYTSGATPVPLVQATTTDRALVSNYPLQRGATGLLNSLYNYNPGICTTGIDPTTLGSTSLLTPHFDPKSLAGFATTIQIQPFDLVNKTVNAACPMPLWIRPRGVPDYDLVPPANRPFDFPPSVSGNYGYRVTLNGTYTDLTNNVKSCSLSEDFSFPVDKKAQSLSVIWSTSIDTSSVAGTVGQSGAELPPEANALSGSQRPVCSHEPGMPASLTLTIGFNTNPTTPVPPVETGTVFMCRDFSQQLNPNYCEQYKNDPTAGLHAVMQGTEYNVEGDGSATPLTKKWVPCSEVTACGIKPTSFTTLEDPNVPGALTYRLKYDNDTTTSKDGIWGCDIRIDVASVDLAGNFRTLAAEPPVSAMTNSIDARHFFRPTDCYICYKKKKRSWGSFIISTILFGPILSCLGGVGGVCRPKGLRYKGYSCTNSLSGADVCMKVPIKSPRWVNDTTPRCPALRLAYPAGYSGPPLSYNPAPEGTIIDDPQSLTAQGGYCDVMAICDGHNWRGVEDDAGGYAPMIECGKVWTRYKIDIGGASPGAAAPMGAPECTIPVPDSASVHTYSYNDLYSGMQVCVPAITGQNTNLLCQATPNAAGGYDINYPTNAMTGASPNTNPNQYYYFRQIVPTPTLPGCPP
jgi:hypothetical protein